MTRLAVGLMLVATLAVAGCGAATHHAAAGPTRPNPTRPNPTAPNPTAPDPTAATNPPAPRTPAPRHHRVDTKASRHEHTVRADRRHDRADAGLPATTAVVTPLASSGAATYGAPGGARVGLLGPSTDGSQTWAPVEQTARGYDRVELLGPPNGVTAWVKATSVRKATVRWAVVVSLSKRELTVFHSGRSVGSWPVAVGAPATPTPTGRTFVAGNVAAVGVNAVEAPLIRPLAMHTTSKLALAEFPAPTPGGQAGVIAIHGWESLVSDPSIFGQAISHGCVRVPAPGMAVMAKVPDGTPVLVDR